MITIISETLPRILTVEGKSIKSVRLNLKVNVGDIVYVKKRLSYGVHAKVMDITFPHDDQNHKVLHLIKQFNARATSNNLP